MKMYAVRSLIMRRTILEIDRLIGIDIGGPEDGGPVQEVHCQAARRRGPF